MIVFGTTISDNPIRIWDDDPESKCLAVYEAANDDGKSFFKDKPDKERGSVRCDCLLVHKAFSGDTVRFIELKGNDCTDKKPYCASSEKCSSTWEHGFHQLYATYKAYLNDIDKSKDDVKMILCTSMHRPSEEKPKARYTQYTQYLKIREVEEFNIVPKVLFFGESDVV